MVSMVDFIDLLCYNASANWLISDIFREADSGARGKARACIFRFLNRRGVRLTWFLCKGPLPDAHRARRGGAHTPF